MKPTCALRVLIVDDSQIVRAVLARNIAVIPNLAVAGVASTGRSGVVAIRDLRPDIVLLDLTMPDGNGFDVLTSIRGDIHQPLFVVITFHGEDVVRTRCFELGAHIFIDKVRDSDVLFEVLDRLGTGALTLEDAKSPPPPPHRHPSATPRTAATAAGRGCPRCRSSR